MRDHDQGYTNKWSDIQKEASESIVARKFQNLLPGADVYIGNYYPVGTSLKQMDENDIIVVYDNVVIVIEVKAGSFTYTPAITDLSAHKGSFGDLIEKADFQCSRTLKYIVDHDQAIFYEENKQIKFSLHEAYKMYAFCVTVDNFDVFEAKIEKTKLFDVADGTIAISLDDLDVYEEHFNDPLCFLHYLKQRKDATRLKHLMLNGE